MRGWPIAMAVLALACGGAQASPVTPRAPAAPTRAAPVASTAVSPGPAPAPILDPRAPLPDGAHARCGTSRMRFIALPEAVSIANDGRILSIENIDGWQVVRDVVEDKTLWTLPDIEASALSPGGSAVVTLRPTKRPQESVLVVSSPDGKERGRVPLSVPKDATFEPLQITFDGRRALAVAGMTVFVVSLEPPRLERKRHLTGDSVLALSGDGTRALVVTRRHPTGHGLMGLLAPVERSGVLTLVELASGRTLRTLGTRDKPFKYSAVALSREGRRLFIGTTNAIDVVDARTGSLRTLARLEGSGLGGLSAGSHRLLVSPDDSQLTYRQRGVHLVDTKTGSVQQLPATASPRAFSPDGGLLLYRESQAAVVRGKHYDVPAGHRLPVTALAFIDRGRRLASAAGSLRLWDPRTGAPLGSSRLAGGRVRLAPSSDGARLAIAGRDLEIADTAGKKLLRIDTSHQVSAVAFLAHGGLLAGTLMGPGWMPGTRGKRSHLRADRTLFRLAPDGRTLGSVEVGDVRSLSVAPDSRQVALYSDRTGGGVGHVELRDVATLQHRVALAPLDAYRDWLAFAGPDTLVAASRRRGAVAFDLRTRKVQARFALGNCCSALAVSPDGTRLAAAAGRDVQLWDIAPRRLLGVFRGHSGDVQALAFSPDGKWLASAGRDTSVLIWAAAAPTPLERPTPTLEKPAVGSLAELARGYRGERLATLSRGKLASPGETLPKLPAGLRAVARGGAASCAITARRKVVCWGSWLGGRLGLNTKSHAPAGQLRPVPGVRDARRIAMGLMYACAIDSHGAASCWGSLGGVIRAQAPRALNVPSPVVDIQIGLAHACALLESGHVVCWGDNPDGQLGTSAFAASSPAPMPLIDDAVAIAVGDLHTCVLRRAGAIFCSGSNRSDQLGDGTGVDSRSPVEVVRLRGARAISADGSASCAVAHDGRVFCWGRLAGFLGSEVHFVRPTPVDALGSAEKVRIVAGRVCVQGGGPVRCARFLRR